MANHDNVPRLTALTADIVSAFVSYNHVDTADIERLISSTFVALQAVRNGPVVVPEKPIAPVSIKKSITREALISMEDGKRYKSLTRHLSVRGMTPADYRTKWGLPGDYPMVAPDYAKRRSELAKASGLGRKAVQADEAKVAPKKVAKASAPKAHAKPRAPRSTKASA